MATCGFFFQEISSVKSFTIYMFFVRINLIHCLCDIKGKCFLKVLKNTILRNHEGNEAGTLHTCL